MPTPFLTRVFFLWESAASHKQVHAATRDAWERPTGQASVYVTSESCCPTATLAQSALCARARAYAETHMAAQSHALLPL